MNPGAAVWTRRPFAKSAEASSASTLTFAATAALIVVAGVSLRLAFAPQVDGLDDAGYLDAAQRVASGRSLDDVFPLFRTRVGMAYVLGWLMHAGVLASSQFWVLTLLAEVVAIVSIAFAGALFTGVPSAGLFAAGLYALYPLAVQQSMMFYPTSFQVAAVALACALVAYAERQQLSARLTWGVAAGVSLGIGYLFKEDIAIAVVALALATVLARFPRVTTAMAVCAGAAIVFFAECAAYWQVTGQPLFRLTASSGLGAPVGDQLQIAQIWRWDAFARSLFLLPLQVGVVWWLALPALWIAFTHRKESRALWFVAIFFLIGMAYLQFGSGSFRSYSPLPKTPRYTALVTAPLMIVLGAWLARLRSRRPRMALAAATLVGTAALPCLFYLQISSSERTRNTMAALPVLDQLSGATVFTDYYSSRVLHQLQPSTTVRTWYHAKFDENRMVVLADPASVPQSYVLLDRQAAKIYTSSYELALPPAVDQPSSQWTPIWQHRAFEDGSLTRRVLEGARIAVRSLPEGNAVRVRVDRAIADMIEGDGAVLYRLPSPRIVSN